MISKDVTVVLPVHIVHMPEMHIGHCVLRRYELRLKYFQDNVQL